jgi:hypothetical protein
VTTTSAPTTPPTPDSTSSSPTQRPTLRHQLISEEPGFQAAPPRPTMDPTPPEDQTQTWTPSPEEIARPDDDGSDDEDPTGTTKPKTGPPRVAIADPALFEGTIGLAVKAGGALVNHRLSPNTGAWFPRDEEVDAIAEPLARIAARHSPAVSGQTSDVMDAIEAAGGVAFYVMGSNVRAEESRMEEQQAAQNNGQQFGPGV